MLVTEVELTLKQLKTLEKGRICLIANRVKNMHILDLN